VDAWASTVPLSAIHWVRVFAPWRTGSQLASAGLRRARARQTLERAATGLDRATVAVAHGFLVPPPPATGEVEPLTARLLVEALPAVSAHMALAPDYDEAYAAWLLGELARVPARGELVAHLVRRCGGRSGGGPRIAGWYVYHLRPGKRSEVLAIAAPNHADVELVLDHLFAHAHRHGAAALRGRLEPSPGGGPHAAPLRAVVWLAGAPAHARCRARPRRARRRRAAHAARGRVDRRADHLIAIE